KVRADTERDRALESEQLAKTESERAAAAEQQARSLMRLLKNTVAQTYGAQGHPESTPPPPTPTWLGLSFVNVTPDLAKENRLPVDFGAMITGIDGSATTAPADLGQLDVVVGLDGKAVVSQDMLLDELRGKPAGTQVELTVLRDKQEKKVKVILVDRL